MGKHSEKDEKNLLELKNVVKHFPLTKGVFFKKQVNAIHAVNGVNLTIKGGKTIGLVGESGCGKTTLGRMILGLLPPTSGEIYFHDCDIYPKDRSHLSKGRINAVFQDPFSSLDPRMNVYQILSEALAVDKTLMRIQKKRRAIELLDLVGLSKDLMNRYPHEFSGGQRQRIAIARALASNSELVIADEPTSALDVSVQAQIINLLEDIQERFNLAYLLISHDLNLVYHISHRVSVMYLGKIVESAQSEDLYQHPLHPYTQALISAVPAPDPNHKKTPILLKGAIQSPIDLPSGCIFSRRCYLAHDECKTSEPPLIDIGGEHYVACIKSN